MAVASPMPRRKAGLGVVLATLATVVAGYMIPGGALVVGLAFAYIVWPDDQRLRYRFAMLAGVVTLVWALFLIVAGSGVFDSVHTHVGTPTVVTGPVTGP